MRSPAAAFAWKLARRNRWGFAAIGLYLAVLAAIRVLVSASVLPPAFADDSFALLVMLPLSATFMYLLVVFSFGLNSDLAARRSIYPARLFSLPVSNEALVGWPMLYGCVTVAAVWTATRSLVVWPPGVDLPTVWPALAAPVMLAWTQALAWIPYPLPGLRVIAIVVLLTLIDVVGIVALELGVGEPVMLALLAPLLPVAYAVARAGVSRARSGETPAWRGTRLGGGRIGALLSSRRGDFSSPERAQAWIEWRRHGRALPALVAILLPFELYLLFLFDESSFLVLETLVMVLLTPPVVAAFVAAAVAAPRAGASDTHELAPFLATRPLTTAALVGAKLRATLRSTLVTWLLVFGAVPAALSLSGTWPHVTDAARRLVDTVGVSRAVAVGALALAALAVSTWKQLVRSLYVRLSGRPWLVRASLFVTLVVLTGLVPLVPWLLGNEGVIGAVWDALPEILAALVVVKITAAVWVIVRLHEGRLLDERTLLVGALCWSVAVLLVYGLLVWLFSLPPSMSRHPFALVAILAVPLARLSAAPLALSRNRHR